MSRLQDIPIRIEATRANDVTAPATNATHFATTTSIAATATAAASGVGAGVTALLSELVRLLEQLALGSEPAAIDLRSLPMNDQDLAELRAALGEGEVSATVDAQGVSHVRETQVAGVWWVEHRDVQGQVIAQSLEVTRIPQILLSAGDEIAAGARNLRAQITAATAA